MELDLTPLPTLAVFDLMLRAMILGQVLLLGTLLLREPSSRVKHLLMACGIIAAALVMLTAPIPDQQYGLLRNLLLVLTDAFAILFWLLIRYVFDDDFRPENWPRVLKALLVLLSMVFLYVLGVQAGVSPVHDMIHVLGLVLILHTVYVALRGFADDLLDNRRRARIMVVLVVGLYSTVLVIFELVDDRFRNAVWFGLVNSVVMLSVTVGTVFWLFTLRYQPLTASSKERLETAATESVAAGSEDLPRLDPAYLNLKQALDTFIADKRYQQNALTIGELARQLECPEHKLRRLINHALGHRNFNSFLNELRLRDACEQLADPALVNTPVLTIALSLGYDSIGPFNRAFKAHTGQAPGDYRRGVQNRR
ncbi:MAG: AraC family transcriptional regulator [Pseudohongiella sp.]|nr:AraC family transcriptional regulator [Pseudohongiella sp.]